MDLTKNKIGIYEKALPNAFTWEQKIKAAKLAGFDFIEISVDESDERLARLNSSKEERKELKKLLDDNGLYFESMCLSGHRRFPFGSKDDIVRQKAYEIMDKAFEYSIDLGINNIQLAGYDVYYEESDEDTLKMFFDGLSYASNKGKDLGITLSIEVMDTWLCGTISRCIDYIKHIDSDHIKVYPDLGNLSRWTETPEKELKDGFDYIVAIHLKDTIDNKFKCVPFGEGDVRFTDLFNTLKDLNYTLPFLIEMWADNDKEYTLEEAVKEISEAKKWLYNRM